MFSFRLPAPWLCPNDYGLRDPLKTESVHGRKEIWRKRHFEGS